MRGCLTCGAGPAAGRGAAAPGTGRPAAPHSPPAQHSSSGTQDSAPHLGGVGPASSGVQQRAGVDTHAEHGLSLLENIAKIQFKDAND